MEYLIAQADNLRDKTIIASLSDSGMRLKEIGNIKASDIDWESLDMVLRYIRSMKFEDGLRLYWKITND